jgi:glutathione S-transferase
MKLYWAPHTRSFSIVWLLEEMGIPYERMLVNIRAGAQDEAAYRAINPMGKVPALQDGDVVVTEQSAICAWLAERYPDKGLAPAVGDKQRGEYLRWLFFAGNCIEPAYMQKASGWTTSKSQASWGNYELVVETLDNALKNGPWILGERFSAADIMIGSGIYFGLSFKLLEPRPSFEAYNARVTARPAFQRAQQIDAEGAASLKKRK